MHKYLELVFDALRPRRTISEFLLSIESDQARSPAEVAHNLLKLVPHLLGAKHLVSAVSKSLQRNDQDAAKIRDIYSAILQQTLSLAQQSHKQKQRKNPLPMLAGDTYSVLTKRSVLHL